jgi:hypothetical protein
MKVFIGVEYLGCNRYVIRVQNCGLALTLVRAVVVEPHSYLYRSGNHGYACCR